MKKKKRKIKSFDTVVQFKLILWVVILCIKKEKSQFLSSDAYNIHSLHPAHAFMKITFSIFVFFADVVHNYETLSDVPIHKFRRVFLRILRRTVYDPC